MGVHGGYGWGDVSFDAPFTNFSAKPVGGIFGGQAGYNWQFGQIVTGVEVDYSAADLRTSGVVGTSHNAGLSVIDSREVKIDQLASARARLGYTFFPGLLAYGTAGLGWGRTEVTETTTVPGVSVHTASSDAGSFGWAAGAGLESKLWSNFIVRAEYLHYGLGRSTYNLLTPKDASTSVDVVRAGLGYKF
jgi:outer membrane immunogenic protein